MQQRVGSGPQLLFEYHGVPIVMPCFAIVLYTREVIFDQGPAVLAAQEAFLRFCPPERLGMYRTENMPKRKPVTAGTLKLLQTWLAPGAPKRDFVSLEINTGRRWNETSDTNFSVFGAAPDGETWESGRPAWICMTFPLGWMADRLEALEAEARRLFASLPFVSGCAGPMLEMSIYDPEPAQQFGWSTVMRYRGFDMNDPLADYEAVLTDGLRSVNWLTFLGGPLAAEFGGAQKLAKAVGPAVDVQPCGSGLCLKAGARPALGDFHANERLRDYEAVFRACEPAIERMIERFSGFMLDDEDEDEDDEKARKLLRRLAYEDA